MPQKTINLNNAEEGFLLVKDVLDTSGRILCREGTVLTKKLILRFLRMGIENVVIKDEVFLSKEEIEQEKKIIERRFQLIGSENSFLFKLKNISLNHLEMKAEQEEHE